MKMMRCLTLLMFALMCSSSCLFAVFVKPASKGKVTVSGRRIYLDGKPFFIKGVGYQPTPIGEDVGYKVFQDKRIYTRDLPLLRKMGCNTIRTWAVADNKEFLDACYNNGKDPIYVITGPYLVPQDFTQEGNKNKVKDEWVKFIKEYKDHPAILMWQAGNEADYAYPNGSKRVIYAMINELAKLAYELEGEKYHPFTTANGGTGCIGSPGDLSDDASMCYLDAWGANMYPGGSFGGTFRDYESKSEKPFWVSEYGEDAFNSKTGKEDQDTHAACVMNLTREIAENSDIVSGGCIMAWADEWWKGGTPSVHDNGGWEHGGFFDGMANEEWWGIVAVEKQQGKEDKVLPRKLYYELEKEWHKELVWKEPRKPKIDMLTDRPEQGAAVAPKDIASAEASSEESAETVAAMAIDGRNTTRWGSVHKTDPSWLMLTLKQETKITGLTLKWETAAAKKYRVEISKDKKNWGTAATVSDGASGETRSLYFKPVTGRYVRIYCEERATDWGYSIWELTLNPEVPK